MDKPEPRITIDPTPAYKPQTVKHKDEPKKHVEHKKSAPKAHGEKKSWVPQASPLTKFLGVILIVLAVMLLLSYFDASSLRSERNELLEQTASLENLVQEKEKAITSVEKEKVELNNVLEEERKGRNIAERQASLTELNKEDAELRVESASLEIQQLTQELDFEKKRNNDLDALIATMKNNTETLKQRITDLNDQLNQCILAS